VSVRTIHSFTHRTRTFRHWSVGVIFFAGVVITGYVSGAGGQTSNRAQPPAKDQGVRVVADSHQENLPPLPEVDYKVYPMDIMRPVYEFVARHGETARYIPCFCVCGERYGHRSLEDCYIRKRAVDGSIIWTDHAMGCMKCIDGGRRVKALYERGMPLDAIRRQIEKEFSTSKHRTLTPWPPGHDSGLLQAVH